MKKKWNKNMVVLTMLALIVIGAFAGVSIYEKVTEDSNQGDGLTIVTSFFPMYIATENIIDKTAGVTLENLSEPQTGCIHDYQLTPEDMKLLSTADVFVINGGGIEEFLTQVAEEYPNLTIIDASENLELLEDNAHAWMSVELHRQQIGNIVKGLQKVDKKNAQRYQENGAAYDQKLAELQQQQEEVKFAASGSNIIIFHEAYEYVARDYGMNVNFLLDLDEERQVSAGEVAEVMDAARTGNVAFVLAEEEYGKEMGDRVTQETGVMVYYLNTLVRGTYDADSYIEKMQENIDTVRSAISR